MDLDVMKNLLIGKNKKIVFPEGDDLRVIGASARLIKDKIAQMVNTTSNINNLLLRFK